MKHLSNYLNAYITYTSAYLSAVALNVFATLFLFFVLKIRIFKPTHLKMLSIILKPYSSLFVHKLLMSSTQQTNQSSLITPIFANIGSNKMRSFDDAF